MTERVVSFGAHGRLAGVFAEPTPPVRADLQAPALLLWNVGINHHVGPYRFNVDLARHAARCGFTSLRFDLSGQGDSEVRRDPLGEMERALDDLREAAEMIAKRSGQQRVLPVGFCSGVDAAHRLALVDGRVVGVCFIEGYSYRTPGFYARYPLRLLDRARWRRAVAYKLPDSLRDAPFVRGLGRIPISMADDDVIYLRAYPTREQLRRDYATLAAGEKRMLFVYVGRDGSYNHPRQLFEFASARGLAHRAEIAFYPNADHTFFRQADRARVVGRVVGWMEKTFGSGTGLVPEP